MEKQTNALIEKVVEALKREGIIQIPEQLKNAIGIQIINMKNAFPILTEEDIVNKIVEEISEQVKTKLSKTSSEEDKTRRDSNTITHEKKKELKKEDVIKRVYEWACKITTEQGEDRYYWTYDTQALLNRLLKTRGNMIAVIGLQGSGKTALRVALEKEMYNRDLEPLSLKWTGSPEGFLKGIQQTDFEFLTYVDDKYFNALWLELEDSVSGISELDAKAELIARRLRLPHDQTALGCKYWDIRNYLRSGGRDEEARNGLRQIITRIEQAVGKEKVKEIRYQLLKDKIMKSHTLLIDFPDYSRRNAAQMNKDLDAFAAFWDSFIARDEEGFYGQKVNLVLFFQKELFAGHFFFGKLDVYELKPLSPRELFLYYTNVFGSTEPFTQEALMELAVLSRGIFRRFKKYIRVCLDHLFSNPDNNTITVENVKEWIGLDMLIQDAELELMTIFPKSREHRVLSVKLLKLLAEKGALPQSTIVNEVFEGADMKGSRVLSALESWGYITREYDGKQKVVKLSSFGR